jgi:hypothetical protein
VICSEHLSLQLKHVCLFSEEAVEAAAVYTATTSWDGGAPLLCHLDLGQMDLAHRCDAQCFLQMCTSLGLPTPVNTDPAATTPPVYQPREDEVSNSSKSLFSLVEAVSLAVTAGPDVSITNSPPSPTVSAPTSEEIRNIDALCEAMARTTVTPVVPCTTQLTMTVQLHGFAQMFWFTPGQVYNTLYFISIVTIQFYYS